MYCSENNFRFYNFSVSCAFFLCDCFLLYFWGWEFIRWVMVLRVGSLGWWLAGWSIVVFRISLWVLTTHLMDGDLHLVGIEPSFLNNLSWPNRPEGQALIKLLHCLQTIGRMEGYNITIRRPQQPLSIKENSVNSIKSSHTSVTSVRLFLHLINEKKIFFYSFFFSGEWFIASDGYLRKIQVVWSSNHH